MRSSGVGFGGTVGGGDGVSGEDVMGDRTPARPPPWWRPTCLVPKSLSRSPARVEGGTPAEGGFPLNDVGGRSLTSPIFELKWASMPRAPGPGARNPGLEGGVIVFGVPENPGERSGGARIGPLDDLGALESTCAGKVMSYGEYLT